MENWRHGAKLLQEWDRGAPEVAWQGQTTLPKFGRNQERRKHPPTHVWQKKLPNRPTSPLSRPSVPDHRLDVSANGDDQLPPAKSQAALASIRPDHTPCENKSARRLEVGSPPTLSCGTWTSWCLPRTTNVWKLWLTVFLFSEGPSSQLTRSQLAIDTTVVCAMHCDVLHTLEPPSVMELFSRRRGRSDASENWWDLAAVRLVVLAVEVGSRWSAETKSFLAHLAKARSRQGASFAETRRTGVAHEVGGHSRMCFSQGCRRVSSGVERTTVMLVSRHEGGGFRLCV